MSSSSKAGETFVRGIDMGGRCASTTAWIVVNETGWFEFIVVYLGSTWIRRQQSPINVRPISHIRRIAIFCCSIQYTLYQTLRRVWFSQKQFYNCRERLQLDLCAGSVHFPRRLRGATHRVRLFHKGVHENTQKLISVVNFVGVFTNNPNQRRFSLRLV
jgi:hypothetical protein